MTCNQFNGGYLRNMLSVRAHLRISPNGSDVTVPSMDFGDEGPDPWVIPRRPSALAKRASQGRWAKVHVRPWNFETHESVVYLCRLFIASTKGAGPKSDLGPSKIMIVL